MAGTTTALRNLVLEIPSDTDDAALQPSLEVARLIRTEDLGSSGLSSDRLDMIELYLAAHFAVLIYEAGGLTGKSYGEAREYYRTVAPSLTGTQSTRFGQMALALDTSGILQSLMVTNKARFSVVRSVQPPNLAWGWPWNYLIE